MQSERNLQLLDASRKGVRNVELAQRFDITTVRVAQIIDGQEVKPVKPLGKKMVLPDLQSRYLSVRQAATYVGLTKQRVWQLVKQGRIAAIRIGSSYVIPIEQLSVFMTQPRQPGRPRRVKVLDSDHEADRETAIEPSVETSPTILDPVGVAGDDVRAVGEGSSGGVVDA